MHSSARVERHGRSLRRSPSLRNRAGAGRAVGSERAARGAAAEAAVTAYLEALGCVVVARNLHVGRYEIDIVARDGPVIAVVEVRTRGPGAWTSAFGSIDAAKRQRLRRAGERLWRQRYRHDPGVERLRFDAASVVVSPEGTAEAIEYAKAAF